MKTNITKHRNLYHILIPSIPGHKILQFLKFINILDHLSQHKNLQLHDY